MLKRDVFIAAMKAGNGRKLEWIITAFSMTRSNPNQSTYDFKIVSDPLGYYYCDPLKEQKLTKISDSVSGQALFNFKDTLELTPDDIPNLKENITSTYGNLLFNWIVLVYAFGDKYPYLQGKVSVKSIEKKLLTNLEDTPETEELRKKDIFYIDEYLKFSEGMYFLTGITQLCTWGATRKTMLPPPGVIEYRNKLIEENKDTLDQLATVAKIDKALIEFDSAYLKGDPGEHFLIDDKSRKIVRKKLFLMHGSELGLSDNTVKADLIQNSLGEGWDITKFPEMNNSSRNGSFSRGAQTQLGGVSVKWLLRASSNMNITIDDCKSRLGGVILVDEANKKRLIGFSIVTQEGSKRIKNEEEAGKYLGKRIMMRNPMYCNLEQTDYCKVCVGDRLSVNPEGLSIAVASYGSLFLGISMGAVHGKELALAKMDYKLRIT
jgi:hypothetical protein